MKSRTNIWSSVGFAWLACVLAWEVIGHAAQLPGTVIGTPGSWQNQGSVIANVFDGDLNTFFDAPDPGTSDWAGLDFGPGATDNITSIVFAPRAGFSSRMVGGKFQGANLADFSDAVTLASLSGPPTEGVYTTITINPPVTTPFRYARYLAPDPSWGNIAELQFWGSGPGVNLARKQPATASTTLNTNSPAGSAVDGNTNTGWLSATGSPQWIYVDMGANYAIASAQLTWGSGYAKSFQLQASADTSTWTTIYVTSGATGGVSTAAFKPTTTRYVRLYCTLAGGTGGYAVQEFAVFGTITAPVVSTLPATAVTSKTANLMGQISATGGQIPNATLYYGTTDGGTSPQAWSNALSLGQQAGLFSQSIAGLTPNTTYYFNAFASNSVGGSWGNSSAFTTPTPATTATISNLPASDVQSLIATVSGQITSAGGGGETPTVTLYYGTSDGGHTPSKWLYTLNLGPQSGPYSAPLSGLVPLTQFFFTASASNSAGITWAGPSLSFTTLAAPPAIPVLTYHYDNTRQGANLAETVLTPANVGGGTFGKLFTYPVDGHVYAQPLIMTNVSIPGKGVHNVVYVATQHDSLYAFDADSNGGPDGGALWHVNFGVSAVTPNNDWGNRYGPYHDINPEVGITATPVIDPNSGTIYLDVFSHEGTVYLHRIHALDLATGAERPFSPVPVAATFPGKGVGSVGGMQNFDSRRSLNRAAFTLAGGILFATYTGYADTDPYHGWIIGFDAATLKPLTNYVFNTSPNSTIAAWGPNAGECGIWMAGHGLCVDANTNIFFEVGNGPFNANVANGTEYGDSFVKLSGASSLAPSDYFTPYNQAGLSAADADLGSGGPILLPDAVGSIAHPHLIVGCGKEGKIYLLDRDNLGHYNPANDNKAVQTIPGAVGGTWSSPAYFNNQIYYLGSGDVLKAFAITNGVITPNPASRGGFGVGYPGSTPVVSANGNQNGIVWTLQSDGSPAVLHANNATNVAVELYNSSKNLARDNPGGGVKYTVPVVANGKVYVPAQFGVSVYGLGNFLATPSISPNGGVFTNSVQVTLADSTPGTAIYYTLDGTTPTTGSIPYTGPFVITNSVSVQAVAAKAGSVNSGIAKAGFLNISAIGQGNGLLGEYWSSQTADVAFSGAPTLIRLDSTVDFEWGNGSPDPTISVDHFTARWTGSLQPQFSETYTLYTTTDDGVRLFINGKPVIDQWVDQAPTEASGSIALKAQQRYTIEMDFYENGGGAVAHLSWSSPSTPKAIIPASQLYAGTNPPPGVVLNSPTDGAFYTAPASVSLDATAAAQYNKIDHVSFYANGTLLGTLTASPYVFTATGLGVGNYALTAVVSDLTGLSSTSAPVNIKVTAGSGLPYGVATRQVVPAYFNMPATFNGALPTQLSQVGVYTDTAHRTTAPGLIPYQPISQLWSDGAVKSRYMAVPYAGGLSAPSNQITFASTGEWAFPSGTVFVKNFDLVTDETQTNAPVRRLETRLIVRSPNGSIYGVTYKWRPDNSDADLLTSSLNEAILITNQFGIRTQNWYYPSPADCLTCHTPAANYVLGVKTRQLDSQLTFAATGNTDNQLRNLNHLGLLNPAIDEATIPSLTHLVSIADTNATLEARARSYIDANCANCHRPNGVRANFDARFDTALADQNIVNGVVLGSLGVDNAHVVTPDDIWRSVLYQRANSLDAIVKMPPLARNMIDTNAVAVIGQWINSLPGTPALPPPTIDPHGGQFDNSVTIALQHPDTNVVLRYTLDNSLPTASSALYSAPFALTTNAIVQVKAFETGFNDSVAATALFTVGTPVRFTAAPNLVAGSFHLPFAGVAGRSYILEASSDFHDWTPVGTNSAVSGQFEWIDPAATNVSYRFYRTREAQ